MGLFILRFVVFVEFVFEFGILRGRLKLYGFFSWGIGVFILMIFSLV